MSRATVSEVPWEHEAWPDEKTHVGWTPEMIEEDTRPDVYFQQNRKHRPFLRKGPMTPETLQWVGNLLLSHPFRFARTMPDNPHWYTLRKEWQDLGPESDRVFTDVNRVVREHGYTEWYAGAPWRMLNVNGFKYWNYYTSRVEEIVVLNRRPISGMMEPFDEIAPAYDHAFSDAASLEEDQSVMDLLGDVRGLNILDIGCGTGLLLDYKGEEISPGNYTGIDPSEQMLDRLFDKHPAYTEFVMRAKLEEFVPVTGPYDLVVSLFGSPAYIDSAYLEQIPNWVRPGGRWVVMFLQDSYIPVAYERIGTSVPFQAGVHAEIPGERREIGQFIAIDGRKG